MKEEPQIVYFFNNIFPKLNALCIILEKVQPPLEFITSICKTRLSIQINSRCVLKLATGA